MPYNGFFKTSEDLETEKERKKELKDQAGEDINFIVESAALVITEKQKAERYINIKNDFDWMITDIQNFNGLKKVTFINTNEVLINLNQMPFKIWGKAFNIRYTKYPRDVRQYSFVASLQPSIIEANNKIWSKFFSMVPDIKKTPELKDIIPNIGKYLNENIQESKKISWSKDYVKSLTLLIRKRKELLCKFSRDITSHKEVNNRHTKFSINGPWGTGLNIKRRSNGPYVIFAQGTGVLPFVDLLHFIVRK